jgi:hypothetical protein
VILAYAVALLLLLLVLGAQNSPNHTKAFIAWLQGRNPSQTATDAGAFFSDVTVEGSGRNYVVEGTWDLHDAKISVKEIQSTIDRSKSEFSLAALLLVGSWRSPARRHAELQRKKQLTHTERRGVR